MNYLSIFFFFRNIAVEPEASASALPVPPTPQAAEQSAVVHTAEAIVNIMDSSNKSISSNDDEKSLKTTSFGKAGINLR